MYKELYLDWGADSLNRMLLALSRASWLHLNMSNGIIAGVCVEGSGSLWRQEGEDPRIALL